MKNVHILQTDQPSRLFYNVGGDLLFTNYKNYYNGVNIYITNNEEIKDWFIHSSHGITNIYKAKSVVGNSIITECGNECWIQYSKKIILTTDQSLDGVQGIEDEFLEWFVNNPSCEEVKFEKEHDDTVPYLKMRYCKPYKIIIPSEEPKIIECYFIPSNNTSSATICGNCGQEKFLHTIGSGIKISKSVIITKEEPKQEWDINTCTYFNMEIGCEREKCICENTTSEEPKQQTSLEEAANRYFPLAEKIGGETYTAYRGFIEGAKSDAARDYWYNEFKKSHYSEEEVLTMLLIKHDGLTPEYVLEQFKKK